MIRFTFTLWLTTAVAFAAGAVIPVIPYLLLSGNAAFVISAVVCGTGLFILGGLVSIFTARGLLFSGFRMLGIGIIAAAVTYFIGRLLGVYVAS